MTPKALLFFNMGPMEILVVVFFILMFFGAESIPRIARTLGRGMKQVKDAANEIKHDIRESADEIQREIDDNKNLIEEDRNESRKS